MSYGSANKSFWLVYDFVKKTARIHFRAFSGRRPDEEASFEIVGPYCDLRRSRRERIILKLKSRQMLKVLREARDVYVSEKGENGVIWNYRVKRCRDF